MAVEILADFFGLIRQTPMGLAELNQQTPIHHS
jgi:hypothetical protein